MHTYIRQYSVAKVDYRGTAAPKNIKSKEKKWVKGNALKGRLRSKKKEKEKNVLAPENAGDNIYICFDNIHRWNERGKY